MSLFAKAERKLLFFDLSLNTLALLLFPLVYTLEGVFRSSYSPLAQTISSLELGSTEWIQRLNFILLGFVVLWLAAIWQQLLNKGWAAKWYPSIRSVEGLGLIALGIFPNDPFHTPCLIAVMIAMSAGLFVMAFYFWKDAKIQALATFSLICGLWPNVVMPFFGIALGGHTALTPYAGLLERVATNADTLWSVVLLIYFWKSQTVFMAILNGKSKESYERQGS